VIKQDTGWVLLEPADIDRLKARRDLPSTVDELLRTFAAADGVHAAGSKLVHCAIGFEMNLSDDDIILQCCELLCRALAEALEGVVVVAWRAAPCILMDRAFERNGETLRIRARYAAKA
jgi:hypothetical protein